MHTKLSTYTGRGYDQIALIQEFNNRGYHTILIDYYPNPPAKNYADFHYQASTLDIDAVKRIAIEEDVDLVQLPAQTKHY